MSLEKLVFGTVYTAVFVRDRQKSCRERGITGALTSVSMVAFIYWGDSRPHDTNC